MPAAKALTDKKDACLVPGEEVQNEEDRTAINKEVEQDTLVVTEPAEIKKPTPLAGKTKALS